MQLRLVLLDETSPPSSMRANSPTMPWEQIDEAARMATLELLARLIVRMLAAQEARELPDE
jgi:hypothetical protein